MHFILDRIALAATLMVVIPAAPAIAVLWGGWLIHQWLFDKPLEVDGSVRLHAKDSRQSEPLPSFAASVANRTLAPEFGLAA